MRSLDEGGTGSVKVVPRVPCAAKAVQDRTLAWPGPWPGLPEPSYLSLILPPRRRIASKTRESVLATDTAEIRLSGPNAVKFGV
jgi:hypothetical protein